MEGKGLYYIKEKDEKYYGEWKKDLLSGNVNIKSKSDDNIMFLQKEYTLADID